MKRTTTVTVACSLTLAAASLVARPHHARGAAIAYQDPAAFAASAGAESTSVRFDVLTPDVVEQQRLSASGAGTFRILHAGDQTAPIALNASAQRVEDALASLSTIGRGNIAVSQPSAGTWDLHFTGNLSGVNVPLVGVDLSNATAGSTATLSSVAHGQIGDRIDGGFFNGVSLRLGDAAGPLAVTDRLPGTPETTYLTPAATNGFRRGDRLDMQFREPVRSVGVLVRAEGPLEPGELRLEARDSDQPLVFTALGAGEPFSGSEGRLETLSLSPANNPVFQIGVGDNLTPAMTADALPSALLEANLEALPAGGAGNFDVTGPVGGPWTIRYAGDFAGLDVPLAEIVLDPASPAGSSMTQTSLANGVPADQAMFFIGISRDELFTEASLLFDQSAAGRYYIEQITHAVPEPASATLLVIPAAVTLVRLRRRKDTA